MPSRFVGGRSRFALRVVASLLMCGFVAWAVAATVGWGMSFPDDRTFKAGDDGRKGKGRAAKGERKAWTTSRVVGSPDPPPPFKVVRAFPNVKFEHPLLLARTPSIDRLFVGEQAGVLYSFPDKPDAKAELFFDLRKELKTIHQLEGAKEVEAVYGLTFH